MKILIVEDEWKTLKGLSNLIAELGGEYEIAGQARSGEEGIRMAMELRPDIIITDIRMNGMTGLEMMKALNDEKLACRYIILSGYAEFQYAKEAISLGSMDYLLKPITKEILEESLRRRRRTSGPHPWTWSRSWSGRCSCRDSQGPNSRRNGRNGSNPGT